MYDKKRILIPAGAALAGAVFAFLLSSWTGDNAAWALRQWLRQLSESGDAGNIAAWGMVLGASAIPALGLFWKGRQQADWLLLLAGAEIFWGLYYLVNPSMIFPADLRDLKWQVTVWAMGALGCVVSTAAVWALLRTLGALEKSPVKLLPRLLWWTAVLYSFLAAAGEVREVLAKIEVVQAGNTDPDRVFSSGVLLWILAALHLAPVLLGVWVIQLGSGLTSAMEDAPFAEETVALAGIAARRCALAARVSLLLAVACNLLQLVWLPKAAEVHFTVYLPVGTLALCAAMLVLCRYFQRAKAVSDDNDSII